MNRILYFFAALISLLCAAQLWQFNIFFRINIYDILIVGFTSTYIVSYFVSKKKISLNRTLQGYVILSCGWFVLATLSGVMIILYNIGNDSYSLFMKGIILLFVYTLFTTVFVIYLSEISYKRRERIIQYYILGVFVSIVFGWTQLILWKQFNIDLDGIIWSHLSSLRSSDDNSFLSEGLAWGSAFRIRGITGDPNVQAAYVLSVLPLLLLRYIQKQEFKYYLLFGFSIISFFLSMSTGASLGLVSSLFVVITVLLMRKSAPINIARIFLLISPLIFTVYYYWDVVLYFLDLKMESSYYGHITVTENTIKLIEHLPVLGFGFNTFSSVYENAYGVPGYNPHSSWLGFLIDMGWVGLLYQIVFLLYIVKVCLHKNIQSSWAFIAAMLGLYITANTYCILELFNVKFFIILFFCHIVLYEKTNCTKYDLA